MMLRNPRMNVTEITDLNQLAAYAMDLIGPDAHKLVNGYDTESDFTGYEHHGIGRYLRNQLKLWEKGSHLYNFFLNTYGIDHPDDMSGILMRKIFKTYNTKAITKTDDSWIVEQLESYKKHWAAMKQLDIGNVVTLSFKGKEIKVISSGTKDDVQ
jgi:hypothetical protein